MLEILPIKLLRDEDAPIFGIANISLGKLARLNFPVGNGIVVTAPELHLKTVLEHYDYGHKAVFEQTLTLVKKEIEKTPVPEILNREVGKHNHFLLGEETLKSVKSLWLILLHGWLEEVKKRLWKNGFYQGIAQNLEPKPVIFIKKVKASGVAFFDPLQDDVIINIKHGLPAGRQGKLHPNDQKKLFDIVPAANRKLFIPHEYEWIVDKGLQLTGVKPYTPPVILGEPRDLSQMQGPERREKSTVRVFLDLSTGFIIEKEIDGIYISSEKIFDLNKPQTSWEELVFKLVECASSFSDKPVFVKLADMSEGMGKVRGALRLIHQKSLLDPLCEALLFARNKKELRNIHTVIPFVRGGSELMQIKRELAVRKLIRKNNFQIWLELAVPENIINLEDYLTQGVDGVVLNLDELSAHLSGYDYNQQEVAFYKHEVSGLVKFLEDGIKLLHKSKIPFIVYGSLSLNPEVLDFLVEKGVYGLVVERFEAPSMADLLHQAEKRFIIKKYGY